MVLSWSHLFTHHHALGSGVHLGLVELHELKDTQRAHNNLAYTISSGCLVFPRSGEWLLPLVGFFKNAGFELLQIARL